LLSTFDWVDGGKLDTRRPWSVSLAVGVIATELAIWAISQLFMLLVYGQGFGSIMTIGAVTFGFALVAILLVFIVRGRNWARIAFVVLAIVSLPGAAVGLAVPSYGTTRLVELVGLAMTVVGAILLLLPESNTWFAGVDPS
jgi:hypothetical protein